MKVELPSSLETYVRDQVASGLYADPDDVVRDALRLKMAHDRAEALKFDALRSAIDAGDADIKAGKVERYHAGFLDDLDTPTGYAAE